MSLRNAASAALWALAGLFPIRKNRVVFSSFYGRAVSDNPAAIAEALRAQYPEAEIVWLLNKPNTPLPEGMRAVDNHSLRRIFTLSTARVWVDNCRKGARRKRKGQFYLQTWHGFAFKQIEKDALDTLGQDYAAYAQRDSAQTDLLVSNGEFMTQVYRRSFWYDGEIAALGSARNDLLFGDTGALCREVRHRLGLPEDRRLVLYAPTFRDDRSTDAYRLDAQRLLSACCARFGGQWSLLVRLHPAVDEKSAELFRYDAARVLDATHYPDLNELFCAADLLITDYSSCMFDYALTQKPCLRFALDQEAYRATRNFYLPSEALPFALAEDNDALVWQIAHFDEAAYAARLHAFFRDYGIFEDGHAAERCAERIVRVLKGESK